MDFVWRSVFRQVHTLMHLLVSRILVYTVVQEGQVRFSIGSEDATVAKPAMGNEDNSLLNNIIHRLGGRQRHWPAG